MAEQASISSGLKIQFHHVHVYVNSTKSLKDYKELEEDLTRLANLGHYDPFSGGMRFLEPSAHSARVSEGINTDNMVRITFARYVLIGSYVLHREETLGIYTTEIWSSRGFILRSGFYRAAHRWSRVASNSCLFRSHDIVVPCYIIGSAWREIVYYFLEERPRSKTGRTIRALQRKQHKAVL